MMIVAILVAAIFAIISYFDKESGRYLVETVLYVGLSIGAVTLSFILLIGL